jgi:hypothetical protein
MIRAMCVLGEISRLQRREKAIVAVACGAC